MNLNTEANYNGLIDSSILPGNNDKNTIIPASFPGPKAATKNNHERF